MKILKQSDIKKYRERNTPEIGHHFHLRIRNPVLDHDHTTGHVRGVLDREINQFIGKCESNYVRFIKWKYPAIPLSFLLRGIADYLERDYSNNPIHPKFISILIKRHSRMDIKSQIIYLQQLGVPQREISKLKIKRELNMRYRNELCKKENQYQV
jgi:hypothetical protein